MFSQKKPYSAVTVAVEQQTAEHYPVEDVSLPGLAELIESIRLQGTGPTEASRAIRKKLKYGSPRQQFRALVLLGRLIENAGDDIRSHFADEPLLERLRVCGTSDFSHSHDKDLKKFGDKCTELFGKWERAGKLTGMEKFGKLNKALPRRKQVATREKSKAIQESENPFEDDEDEEATNPPRAGPSSSSTSQPSTIPYGNTEIPKLTSFSHVRSPSGSLFSSSSSKKKDKDAATADGSRKKDKRSSRRTKRPVNLEQERDKIKVTIADGTIARSNLISVVLATNREKMRISENEEAVRSFDGCKKIRRKVVRYIHLIAETDQDLPSDLLVLNDALLKLNESLVEALMTFEQLDRSIDADSDSEDEIAEQAHMYRMAQEKGKHAQQSSPPTSPSRAMAGLSLSSNSARSAPLPLNLQRSVPPPRPSAATKPPSSSLLSPQRPKRPVQQQLGAPRAVRTYVSDEESEEEDGDGDDPFADRNAVRG